MVKVSKGRIELLLLIVLFSVTFILRFYDLSYSEFQGDEIRALYQRGAPLQSFLLNQRKGPVQFLVTYLISFFSSDYNEFVTRVPFAFVGTLSVFVLYFLVKQLYGIKTAFFAALLFSVNGFFVAFSRIVQYQAFTYFFYLTSLFFAVKLMKTDKLRYLYSCFIFLGLGFLAHYDSVFIAGPLLVFLSRWFFGKLSTSSLKFKALNTFLALIVFAVFVGSFYIPFVLNPGFSSDTTSYFFTRLTGEEAKTTDTLVTYKIYNPLLSFYFLISFTLLALVLGFKEVLPVILWLVLPYVVMNFVIAVPGTHIYTYVLPMIVLASYGLVRISRFLRHALLIRMYFGLASIAVGFLLFQSYLLFVDHSVEYPWFEKKILGYTVSLPDPKYHLSIFGFPYNRKLRDVNSVIERQGMVSNVLSNENSKIVSFYVKPLPSLNPDYTAYIFVNGPQSLTRNKKASLKDVSADATFYRDGILVSEVYFLRNSNVR